MYTSSFGITHAPLGKNIPLLWDNGQITHLSQKFQWLLQTPGIGLLTAEPGLGKTAALRQITATLNPHQYQVIYVAETDFGRLDFYRQLACKFGLTPSFRRAQLWRDIKEYIVHMATQKNILPVLIIDEAQNLPSDFFRDLPSFINFVFDSKDYMTLWLVGHTELARELNKPCHAALASRIHVRCELKPLIDREAFRSLIQHGFNQAGLTTHIVSDSGIELIRMASQGNPRKAHQIIVTAMRLAADNQLNHLPDDVVQNAITMFKSV
jgi:type II secretory pathway predicted ATPase ExeA